MDILRVSIRYILKDIRKDLVWEWNEYVKGLLFFHESACQFLGLFLIVIASTWRLWFVELYKRAEHDPLESHILCQMVRNKATDLINTLILWSFHWNRFLITPFSFHNWRARRLSSNTEDIVCIWHVCVWLLCSYLSRKYRIFWGGGQ